ncbi:MAG: hemolysin family protein, partial [Candidatus Xenobia bacterium]
TEQVAMFVARPMAIFVSLCNPLITLLSALANRIVLAFGLQPRGQLDSVHSVEELQTLVQQSHAAGVLDDLERQMLQRTFQFGELTAADIMIPRTDIEALDVSMPQEELRQRILTMQHSRLPVYEDTLDNVLGVVHVRQLIRVCAENHPIDLKALVNEPLIVPESVHLDNLLQQIQNGRRHIALVIDEYGGTAGLVTAEDIVEEVFGDFMDMREAQQKDMQQVAPNEYVVRGIMHLHELQEALGWNLEETDASTVGGYVLARLGRAAQVGDAVDTPFGSLKVEKMTRYRITQVRLVNAPKGPPHDSRHAS